ncbi:MAG: TIGR00266 family protein [Archaeoglobaceae archaeon]
MESHSSPTLNIDVKWGGAKTFFAGKGLFLLKIEGSGDLFLSSFGGIEVLEVDGKPSVYTRHIVEFEDSLDFKIKGAGGLKATLFSGEGLVAEFNGKGKVWIQTGLSRNTWDSYHLCYPQSLGDELISSFFESVKNSVDSCYMTQSCNDENTFIDVAREH